MSRTVQRRPVEQDEILVGQSAAHGKTGRSLAGRLNPREHLDDFDDIPFAQEGWHFSDDVGIDGLQSRLGLQEP